MDVGVISDVHGNAVALEAVLEDMPPVDALVNAGDVVGYNPWPRECLRAMRSPSKSHLRMPITDAVPSVVGNHDRAVAQNTGFRFNAMAQAGVEYAREHLDDPDLAWLGELPDRLELFDDRVTVVHGHPDDPDHYTYPREFAADLLDRVTGDVLVMGHTHVQHHESYPDGIVMNPGSVGQPRDEDPRAAYAILDLDEMTVAERRVEYDIEMVQEAVQEAGLPEQIGRRLSKGR